MVKEVLEEVCRILTDAGIAASYDPPRVHAPGAFVSARRIADSYLDGSYSFAVAVTLIAPATEIPRVYEILDDMLQKTLDSPLGGMVTETDLGEQITLGDGSTCPAYYLEITTP